MTKLINNSGTTQLYATILRYPKGCLSEVNLRQVVLNKDRVVGLSFQPT
jgi:hypothetical protein